MLHDFSFSCFTSKKREDIAEMVRDEIKGNTVLDILRYQFVNENA